MKIRRRLARRAVWRRRLEVSRWTAYAVWTWQDACQWFYERWLDFREWLAWRISPYKASAAVLDTAIAIAGIAALAVLVSKKGGLAEQLKAQHDAFGKILDAASGETDEKTYH